MTIHINLSPEMEGYVKSKVASGFYGNATEVIRDAIRRMQSEDDRMGTWRAAIAKGESQLDRGEGAVHTPELMESLTKSAIEAMHSDQPVNPDALP
jgi:antitoxin ParD1/3/4